MINNIAGTYPIPLFLPSVLLLFSVVTICGCNQNKARMVAAIRQVILSPDALGPGFVLDSNSIEIVSTEHITQKKMLKLLADYYRQSEQEAKDNKWYPNGEYYDVINRTMRSFKFVESEYDSLSALLPATDSVHENIAYVRVNFIIKKDDKIRNISDGFCIDKNDHVTFIKNYSH